MSGISIPVLLGVLLCTASEIGAAQVIRVKEGPIVPVALPGRPLRRADDPQQSSASVALYASAFLGEPGQVEGLPPNAGTHFPTVHLLFSAAALPRGGGYEEVGVLRNLRQFNAHVRIMPLDSAQREVTDLLALEILGTFPDSFLLAQHIVDTSNVQGAAFKAVTRGLLPALDAGRMLGARVGPMVARFAGVFHHPRSAMMVPYISDAHEFGWVWHETPDQLIEGTHRAAATLEVVPQVRYLEVRIQLTADWRSHGAWQRELEIVIDLGPGQPSAAP